MASLFLDPLYIVTFIGEPWLWAALAAALVAIYFVVSRRQPGKFALFKRFLIILVPTLLVVLLLALFLKAAFPVARPCVPCTLVQEAALCNPYCPVNDPSFPSAHAAVAFGAFASLWLVQRKGWQLVVFIIPLAVAASRVGLGVHTWLDVLTGSLIGLLVAAFFWREGERRLFRLSLKNKR
jgi:membrane-associated phospholipid phosphatase